jgi:UDP-3-O-[3-hydroxymyristoyl] glucosamine N-acyltransferase
MAAGLAGLVGDVEPGARVAGVPHMDLRVWRRAMLALRSLPELLARVRRLERALGAAEKGDGSR